MVSGTGFWGIIIRGPAEEVIRKDRMVTINKHNLVMEVFELQHFKAKVSNTKIDFSYLIAFKQSQVPSCFVINNNGIQRILNTYSKKVEEFKYQRNSAIESPLEYRYRRLSRHNNSRHALTTRANIIVVHTYVLGLCVQINPHSSFVCGKLCLWNGKKTMPKSSLGSFLLKYICIGRSAVHNFTYIKSN